MSWIVCQIGAREHYAIPCALLSNDHLAALITDFWVPPSSLLSKVKRLGGRYHSDLSGEKVHAANLRMLAFELGRPKGWEGIIARNALFQKSALRHLGNYEGSHTLFSYSYAALDLFRFAKSKGWKTVLGQIDPGPVEERIVGEEHDRYPNHSSSWQPAPASYWDQWREEIELADRIIVNSPWSRDCLLQENVPEQKIEIVPLAYTPPAPRPRPPRSEKLNVLFLGQINLRKGIGRLLEAMELLKEEPIHLILAGPTEVQIPEAKNITHLGPLARSEVHDVYAEADLFILPTLSDGFALTQLEAAALGVPLLVSKHCGDVVRAGENGWVLDDLEPDTIAAALRKAHDELPLSASKFRDEFTVATLAQALS